MATRITQDAVQAEFSLEDDDSSLGSVDVMLTDIGGLDKNAYPEGDTPASACYGTLGQTVALRKINVTYQNPPSVTSPTPGAMVIMCSKPMARDSSILNEVELVGDSFITGEWDPNRIYSSGQCVVITMGSNAGTYVDINATPASGNAPYAGDGNWMQLPGSGLGVWL